MKRSAFIASWALLLAACGSVGTLEPAPGQSLPVKPLLAERTPTPDELLDIPDIARPERVDELMRRSEPREPDRFDLPPPSGGASPFLEGDEEPESTEVEGPVDPL